MLLLVSFLLQQNVNSRPMTVSSVIGFCPVAQYRPSGQQAYDSRPDQMSSRRGLLSELLKGRATAEDDAIEKEDDCSGSEQYSDYDTDSYYSDDSEHETSLPVSSGTRTEALYSSSQPIPIPYSRYVLLEHALCTTNLSDFFLM